MLHNDARMKRVTRCHLLISSVKNEAAKRISSFSDKKMLTCDVKIYRRNDRWLARYPENVLFVARMKFPASVHVLSVVSSEGGVMPPYFFQKGETDQRLI